MEALFLFAPDMSGVVDLVWALLIFLIVVALVHYIIDALAPDPLKKFATVIAVAVAVLILLTLLTGGGIPRFK